MTEDHGALQPLTDAPDYDLWTVLRPKGLKCGFAI